MVKRLILSIMVLGLITACCGKRYEEAGVPPMPKSEVSTPEKVAPQVKPQQEKPTQPVTVKTVKREEVFYPKPIHFDFDRADILPQAKPILDKLCSYLKSHPDVKVRIEGNCDERGTEEYNLALGQRRADSAKNYLIFCGISPSRITTISYGEDNPVCTEHNESCWWRNRRCDFRLSK